MKKVIAILMVLLMTASVSACPAWECNYDVSDYSCGGYHGGGCTDSWGYDYQYDTDCYGESAYTYDEYSTYNQPLYCQYCGNESWACTCGTGSNYDCNYNYDYDYDCGYQETYFCGSGQMDHWANIRDCYGNVIGQAGAGDSIEVCRVDSSDPDRVYIYDYSTECYGSVLSDCVYGGYQWDGTGDNGFYNSYQGGNCGYAENQYYPACASDTYLDCGGYAGGCYYSDYYGCGNDYDYSGDCYGGYVEQCGSGCSAYSDAYYVTYCETIIQRCVTYGFGGMGGLRCRV